MNELSSQELLEVSGGFLGKLLKEAGKAIASGVFYDVAKSAAGSMGGLDHNSDNPMAATNRL